MRQPLLLVIQKLPLAAQCLRRALFIQSGQRHEPTEAAAAAHAGWAVPDRLALIAASA